jgi:indolepyruvate ferredoxin oxidoreductase
MYICVCVYVERTYVQWRDIIACTRARVCTCACPHIHSGVCEGDVVCMYVCMRACMYVCMYVFMMSYFSTQGSTVSMIKKTTTKSHTYAHTNTHTYAHTHTHTHTHTIQDCGKASNCVAVSPLETALGRKRKIDQTLCTQDTTCVNGFCPSFVTVAGGVRRKHSLPQALRARPLPDVRYRNTDADNDGGDVLVCGVGGTGVVTVAALLGMAAHIEGRTVNVFDQIGLSQKGGPVVSHVRIMRRSSRENEAECHVSKQSCRISDGSATAVLACDVITALLPHNLACVGQNHTQMFANSAVTLPGSFARNPDMQVPLDQMVELLTRSVGEPENIHAIDFTQVTQAIMGDAVLVNVVMLGYALQAGALPVGVRGVEDAIKTLGVSVQQNLDALDLGRRLCADTQYVLQCAGLHTQVIVSGACSRREGGDRGSGVRSGVVDARPGHDELIKHDNDEGSRTSAARTHTHTLQDAVKTRSLHLRVYQDEEYAQRYEKAVNRMLEVERGVLGEGAGDMAMAMARGYHKVLAYKDEYEVCTCDSCMYVCVCVCVFVCPCG